MPTYVYACSACNTTFEVEQRITEDPLTTCECGSSGTVKRVIQPVGISFKGSGFHINDYNPSRQEPTSDKAESAGKDASSEPATSATPDSTGADKGANKAADKGSGTGETKGESKGEPSSTPSSSTKD